MKSRFQSLAHMLRAHAEATPDKRALVFSSGKPGIEPELSFAELHAQSATLARELADRAAPGERVLLIFPSGLEFVVGYFACLIAGLVAVPLMPPRRNANQDSSAAIIADCTPALALTGGDSDDPRGTLRDRLAEAGIPRLAVELRDDATADWPDRSPADTDLAFLQYTSGSTSTPKGVMVSHRNLLANLELMRRRFGNDSSSTHVSWIPLYHDLGLIMNLLEPLYCGATCVLMLPSGFMHRPLNWLKAIARFEATVAAAPNFAYHLCVDRFGAEQMAGVDLSRWSLAVNGAEPVRAATMAAFVETFAPFGFDARTMHPTYGLAEATLVVSGSPRGERSKLRDVSADALKRRKIAEPQGDDDRQTIVGNGTSLDEQQIVIVDPDSGHRSGVGAVGEIWVAGPSVATGYWNRPDESDATFRATIRDDEDAGTFLRTGDLGYLDDDGELFIVGRIKDVIIIRGVNHYPQDIEASIADANPALRRDFGAVFCVPDAAGGEQLVVVQEVERTHRHSVDETEITAAIRAAAVNNHEVHVAQIALIRTGSIPRTTSGKIQRSKTKQLWLDGALDIWEPRGSEAADTAA